MREIRETLLPFVHFHFVQTQSDKGTQRALFLQFSANDLNPSIQTLRLIGAKKQKQISSDLIIIDHWISISFNFSSFLILSHFAILFFLMILYTFLLRPDFFLFFTVSSRETSSVTKTLITLCTMHKWKTELQIYTRK